MPSSNKKLVFVKENHKTCLWPLCMTAEMLKYRLYKLTGSNKNGETLGEWKNRLNRWAVESNSKEKKIAEKIFKKASQDQEWLFRNIKLIYFYSDQLTRFTRKIFNYDLKLKSDKELLEFYLGYREEFLNMYAYAWLPNVLEGETNFFSSKLEDILRLKLEKINKADKFGQFMSTLSAPTKLTNREKEDLDLLRISSVLMGNKDIKNLFSGSRLSSINRELQVKYLDIYKIIYRHYQKYCWIPFDYDGPAWDLEYFLEKMKKIIKSETEINQKVKEIKDEKIRIRKLQKRYEAELNFSKDRQASYLFEITRELLFLKDYRKDALFKSYYHMDKLINEIGRRLSLSPIQVKHILPQEMEDALVKRKYSEAELNRRISHSVLLYKDAKKGKHPKKPIQIFTGKEAERIVRKKIKTKNINVDVREIIGQAAYLGTAKGRIKLIFSTDDLDKMRQGDVLVSPATNPNLLPAMKKAIAIVTDEGGITCHAAIVSRELKKPCVIGTKIATQVLKDGDLVEVDANTGVVKILK